MTLKELPFDPESHSFRSADLLTAGRLSELLAYAKSLEIELQTVTDAMGLRIAELEQQLKERP